MSSETCAETTKTAELTKRVEAALDGRVRQVIEAHGGGITVLDVRSDGHVRLKLEGRCSVCPTAAVTMRSLVTPALLATEGVAEVTRRGGASRFAEKRIAELFGLDSIKEAVGSGT